MSENQKADPGTIDNSIRSIAGIPLTGNRVRAVIELAENHSKPNLILTLTDPDQNELSRSMILGSNFSHIEFTLHVRVPDPPRQVTLTCVTYIDDNIPIDTQGVEITLES